MEENVHISSTDLSRYLKEALGEDRDVVSQTNMYSGAQKVVYRVDCSDGFQSMLYIWDESKNYFQAKKLQQSTIHESSGAELFEYNYKFLTERKVRTPEIYLMNREREEYVYDFAIVQYISGGSVEQAISRNNVESSEKVLNNVGILLRKMHAIQNPFYGSLWEGNIGDKETCEEIILREAIENLDYLSKYIDQVKVNQHNLTQVLRELQGKIKPRKDYRLIHGELGPDHIMVDERLEVYLIDIEGMMFFDVEFEHSFLDFRFGDSYQYLADPQLDKDRLLFYKLHHHLSCTTGGLKLVQRGFHNPTFAQEIMESNLRSSLEFLRM
jgi:hypothetical protein